MKKLVMRGVVFSFPFLVWAYHILTVQAGPVSRAEYETYVKRVDVKGLAKAVCLRGSENDARPFIWATLLGVPHDYKNKEFGQFISKWWPGPNETTKEEKNEEVENRVKRVIDNCEKDSNRCSVKIKDENREIKKARPNGYMQKKVLQLISSRAILTGKGYTQGQSYLAHALLCYLSSYKNEHLTYRFYDELINLFDQIYDENGNFSKGFEKLVTIVLGQNGYRKDFLKTPRKSYYSKSAQAFFTQNSSEFMVIYDFIIASSVFYGERSKHILPRICAEYVLLKQNLLLSEDFEVFNKGWKRLEHDEDVEADVLLTRERYAFLPFTVPKSLQPLFLKFLCYINYLFGW